MLDVRPGILLALGVSFASCVEGPASHLAPSEPDPVHAAPEAAANVVLVTIDGVRWQEIFTGADPDLADAAELPRGEARAARALTPNLHHLFFDQGTVLGDPRLGEHLSASGPNFVSLPGYVEIMTGAPSGCAGNDCEPTLPWAITGAVARSSAPEQAAAVFASWERVARAVPDGHGIIVHAGRAASDAAPPYPGNGDYLPDAYTAAMAIDHLVRRRPRFLWVALGDTDEWAHRHDYRGYVEALRFADGVVGEIAAHLAEMDDYGARTAIFVTTDHGRDPGFANHGGPASAGVWLMAGGGPVKKHGPVPLPRVRHLSDVAPTLAAILGETIPRGGEHGEVLDDLL
jgi:hypothetical protein